MTECTRPTCILSMLGVLLFLGILLQHVCALSHGIRLGGRQYMGLGQGETGARRRALLTSAAAAAGHISSGQRHGRVPLKPTSSGYVPVRQEFGSEMLAVFFEAQEPEAPLDTTPILLWLQGGPGCSSLFGMLYINGPYFVNEDLTLRANLGTWNRQYGMLFIEQPIGVGYSRAGKQSIPGNELAVAADLYLVLNHWYQRHPQYAKRPLIITGESYAGKYVPSIGHYVLQATAQAQGTLEQLEHPRVIGKVEPPAFKLGGIAIGNGWTDANVQQTVQGQVAWAMGLIDGEQRQVVEAMNQRVLDQVRSHAWRKARTLSDQVNEYISNVSGTYTLEDVRRNLGYDGYELVDAYLNQPHVKRTLQADHDTVWVSCSPEVDHILGHDVMKSVKRLVADLLHHHPVLLYHGQFDAECGVASNDAWISSMTWTGHEAFQAATRQRWVVNGRVLGFLKGAANLSVLVVRNTGHMVPHDNPYYGQLLIERWVTEAVQGKAYTRQYSEEEERAYLKARGQDEGQSAGPPQ